MLNQPASVLQKQSRLPQSAGITGYSFNDVNEMTATSGGGVALYQGTTNKPIKSAKVNSTAATLPTSTSFFAQPTLSTGNNSSTVNAVDGNNNSVTNTYQVGVQGGPSASLTFDANGNMTSDGTNSYSWDCENRMIKITYPGSSNFSSFVYDGLGRNVSIVETTGGSVASTKQFVWCGHRRSEARNATSALTAQYFGMGESIGGTNYYFTKDDLGSIREMTNSSGALQAQYSYDLYGRTTKILETVACDFGFGRYYVHSRSSLDLAVYREYSPAQARWISRDPIGEMMSMNLYEYAYSQPAADSDLLGLWTFVPLPPDPTGAKSWASSFISANYPEKVWNPAALQCMQNALQHLMAGAWMGQAGWGSPVAAGASGGWEAIEFVSNVANLGLGVVTGSSYNIRRYTKQLQQSCSDDTIIDLANDTVGFSIGQVWGGNDHTGMQGSVADHAACQCNMPAH